MACTVSRQVDTFAVMKLPVLELLDSKATEDRWTTSLAEKAQSVHRT